MCYTYKSGLSLFRTINGWGNASYRRHLQNYKSTSWWKKINKKNRTPVVFLWRKIKSTVTQTSGKTKPYILLDHKRKDIWEKRTSVFPSMFKWGSIIPTMSEPSLRRWRGGGRGWRSISTSCGVCVAEYHIILV